jgi:hypothetical protein
MSEKVDLYEVASIVEGTALNGKSREHAAKVLNDNGLVQPTGDPWTPTAISYLGPLFGGFKFKRGRAAKFPTLKQ